MDEIILKDVCKKVRQITEVILVGSIGKIKNFKKTIEMARIAFTNYEKVLVELRSALRGDEFNKNELIDKIKIMDEMIIDKTPLADRFVEKYQKKYLNYK